ncbi:MULTISPECIES: alpha/beta hydrolase [unclassified Nitrospina]|uniref:alpha/beta hydrolase n=1 Tax=unclassified Nitrospina TaxID=2638683 RepID=UPI003F9696EA
MKGKRIFETAAAILAILVFYAVVLVSCENKIIYHPHTYPDGEWDAADGMPVEDVWFTASDGTRLHGWYFPAIEARATLLFFHGNAGNLTHRVDNIQRLTPLGLNVFIFDYRGYGKSEGAPDEAGILQDAQAAYDTLVKERKVPPDTVILFGRSLGAAFATDVAHRNPAAALILEAAFTSARDMAGAMFPILPIGWAIRSKLNAVDKVPDITIPKLIIHGTGDEVVPYKLGRKLYDAAAEPKAFYDLPGAGHNNTYRLGGQAYFDRIHRFVDEALAEGKPKLSNKQTP